MNKLATRIKNVGPGALVAAAFIGPGTVTSCSISGATAGYTLLWAMLLSVISVIIMQSMAARLGIVSGMGLGEALRTKFTGSGARILISILVIAAVFIGNIAYETGNLTGSILGIQAAVPAADNPTIKVVLALILGIIAFALLFSGSYQSVENFLTALVVLMGVIFLICAFAAKPDWGAVIGGLFGFKVPDGGDWMTVAALMGTTVVPYNIYLHAASASTKWGGSAEKDHRLRGCHDPCDGRNNFLGCGYGQSAYTASGQLGNCHFRYRPVCSRNHEHTHGASCGSVRMLRYPGLGRGHEAGEIQGFLDRRTGLRYFCHLHTGSKPYADHPVRAGCKRAASSHYRYSSPDCRE